MVLGHLSLKKQLYYLKCISAFAIGIEATYGFIELFSVAFHLHLIAKQQWSASHPVYMYSVVEREGRV